MRARSVLVRIVVSGALGALAATAGVGQGGWTARAQGAEGAASALGGFQGSAAASGLHAFYTPEGLLPLGSIVDIGAPDALATIVSGPATFARASAADPGDLLANPDAILSLGVPGYPQGSVPAYPYRVSATSGFGEPRAESSPAPGLNARVEVGPSGSTAQATMPRADAPAVATFGSLSSLATTTTDGSTVAVHVRTEISGFRLLDLLVIDSIVTDLTASSDGGPTQLSGGTTISGASVLGQSVTIDADGVHPAPADSPSDPLLTGLGENLNDVLAVAGVRVTVAGPVEQQGTTASRLASSGLRVDLEVSDRTFPVLGDLVDALPPIPPLAPGAPTVDDVLAAARARHLTRLEVAQGAVSLSARPSPARMTRPVVAAPPAGALTATSPSISGSTPTGATLTPEPALPVAPMITTRAAGADIPLGAGVGALALLLFLVQPIVGARLARMATTILAADDGVSCPRERR